MLFNIKFINFISLITTFFLVIIINAQNIKTESIKIDSTRNWTINGQNNLMVNQAAFSNWIGGGISNVGWLAGINYNITYEKDKNLLENIIILDYGENSMKGIGTRKTQDVINLSSNYGRRISHKWYASAGVSLHTLFASGYEENNNPGATKISNFMAPGCLNIGAGVTYRPNKNFTVTLRPANARWTFVLDKELQKAGNYGLKQDGDKSLFQFGFLAMGIYKLKVMEDVTLTNTAFAFANYLDHPERLILSYNGVLNMKINKFLTTMLTVDLFYDHNQIQKVQLKQTLGVGLAYNIDTRKK
ncbi:DUF3078 domain-containing protein [Chryseobacterium kwangjuense]|uniref:DUF3078 domain-containing protein n=1 Tax=Chryseobacterium kwangjuense TaxID=267125 RepID=A0ABW9K718_9FLAO